MAKVKGPIISLGTQETQGPDVVVNPAPLTLMFLKDYKQGCRSVEKECSTCKRRQGREVVVRGLIQLAQWGAQSLTQPLHHALDARDVVVGGANEGKKAFGGVLAQHSHTWGETQQHI